MASLNNPSGKHAEVNGIKMYYEIVGAGYPLVLIHGGGSTIETSFGRIVKYLSAHYQVIAVELQAHGHTSDRDSELSFEQDADDVATLLSMLGIERAHIFGFSNGATTSIQLAIRHPHFVNKIVAASGLYKRDGAPSQFWDFMNQAKIEHMPQQYKDAYLDISGSQQALQIMHDKCAKRMVSFADISDKDLSSIQAPVLFINGEMDVAKKEHLEDMMKLLPNSSLKIFEGGHGEYMGEITTLKEDGKKSFPIVQVIMEFLNGNVG